MILTQSRFNSPHLKGDIFGGVTAAVVSLPLALAFGVASGAGATAGLYGALCVGLFAALFGSSKTLISEPTGPMTVVMTAILTSLMADNPDNGLAMAFTVVIIAGCFQILLGFCGVGKYITMMPYSVISGFMSGIGVILIILQLAPLMGHAPPVGGPLATLEALPSLIMQIQLQESIIAISVLTLLFLFPKKYGKRIPLPLVALVAGSVISFVLFDSQDVRRIGEIPLGMPSITIPTFTNEQFTIMLWDGIILGTLGCIDALLTAVIADNLTREEHDSNRELIGQGVGNVASGFIGGLPGAGATMGTVVNIQSGGTTAVSGVVRVIALAVIMIGASQLTQHIPLAVLAAITCKVGFDILDWGFLKRAHKISWQVALIMFSVMLLTVAVDLIFAVAIGVFIANIITIEKLSKIQSDQVKAISDADDAIVLTDTEKTLFKKLSNEDVLLMYLSGPLIFGMAKAISRQYKAIKKCRILIIDLTDVKSMDATISITIENMISNAQELGKDVFIVCKEGCETTKVLNNIGTFSGISKNRILYSREDALLSAIEISEHRNDGVSLKLTA